MSACSRRHTVSKHHHQQERDLHTQSAVCRKQNGVPKKEHNYLNRPSVVPATTFSNKPKYSPGNKVEFQKKKPKPNENISATHQLGNAGVNHRVPRNSVFCSQLLYISNLFIFNDVFHVATKWSERVERVERKQQKRPPSGCEVKVKLYKHL